MCLFRGWQALTLGIMAGMNQKDVFALIVDPVVAQRLFPMVQTVLRTIEIHQLLLNTVIDVPVVQVVQLSEGVDIPPVVTQRVSP